jgi:uncharacterized membrane protein (UPF0127 family)
MLRVPLVVAAVSFMCSYAGPAPAVTTEPPWRAPNRAPSTSAPGLPVTALVIFGTDTVFAEVAQSQAERSQGLMYRESLPENGGMLFIFPEAAVRSFWMQNTYIPLDIAFMDQQFRILNIEQMEPMTMDSHASRGPAAYALETNQGWFAARGIGPGAVPRVEFRQ